MHHSAERRPAACSNVDHGPHRCASAGNAAKEPRHGIAEALRGRHSQRCTVAHTGGDMIRKTVCPTCDLNPAHLPQELPVGVVVVPAGMNDLQRFSQGVSIITFVKLTGRSGPDTSSCSVSTQSGCPPPTM